MHQQLLFQFNQRESVEVLDKQDSDSFNEPKVKSQIERWRTEVKLWHIHQSSKRRLKRLILKYGNVEASYFGFQYLWKIEKNEACSVWFSVLLVHNDMRLLSWKFIWKSRYTGEFSNPVPFQRWTICLIFIQLSNILIYKHSVSLCKSWGI